MIRLIRPLLEIEAKPDLDLPRLSSVVCSAEEIQRSHSAAEAVQLGVIQQIIDLELECHGGAIVVLVVVPAVAAISAIAATAVSALATEITIAISTFTA